MRVRQPDGGVCLALYIIGNTAPPDVGQKKKGTGDESQGGGGARSPGVQVEDVDDGEAALPAEVELYSAFPLRPGGDPPEIWSTEGP